MVSSARSPDLSGGYSHGRLTLCRSAERPAAGRWSARQVAPPAERAAAGPAAPMRHYNLKCPRRRPDPDALGTDHTASDAQADVFHGVHSEALHAFRKVTKDTLRVRSIPWPFGINCRSLRRQAGVISPEEPMNTPDDPTRLEVIEPASMAGASESLESAGLLDGVWFRKERERLALGRRTVAAQLRIAEGRIVVLEQRRMVVPSSWLPVVASLGFRLPQPTAETVAQGCNNSQNTAVVLPEPARPTKQSADHVSASSPALTVAEQTLLGDPSRSQPEPGATERLTELRAWLSELPRGQGLREQRHRQQLSAVTLCKALSVPTYYLGVVESNNLVLPPQWLPVLRALGIYAQVEMSQIGDQLLRRHPTGGWLQNQRQQRGLSTQALGERLGVRPSLLAVVEARRWPLSPEWLGELAKLGYPVPNDPVVDGDRGALSIAAPRLTVEPLQPSVPAERPSTPPMLVPAPQVQLPPPEELQPAALPPKMRQPVNGAWFRAERERLGLTRNTVRLLLHIDMRTCVRVEQGQNRVLRRWWPKLRELGFRFPEELPERKVPAVPMPKGRTKGSQRAPRGAWLRRQRKRLGLSEKEVWTALQVHWRTMTAVERHNRQLPTKWLPTLRRLGMSTKSGAETPKKAHAAVTQVGRQLAASPAQPTVTPTPTPLGPSRELFESVVSYRLTMGLRSGQPAVETMACIAHDLQTYHLSQAITHDQLAAFLERLLNFRSGS